MNLRESQRPSSRLVGLLSLAAAIAAGSCARAGEVTLEDQSLLVAFDGVSGALTRLVDKTNDWTIERRPELGVSFRLHAPLPDRRDNFVLGAKQRAAEVEKLSGHQIRLRWKDLLSEHGGVLPLTFTSLVTLDDGALTFNATLDNASALTVETVDYPYFGDVGAPKKGEKLVARTAWYGNLTSDEVGPKFVNQKGYWGVFYPTKTPDNSRSLFCLIQAPQGGLYVETADPAQPSLIQYTFEQHPGFADSADSRVPREEEIGGTPVHLEFRACHFLFVHPHSTQALTPVVVAGYRGDWHAGVDRYKRWRTTWYRAPHLPSWVQEVHSWLQLQINGSEEDRRIPYSQLPAYGEECARNEVGAIQLVGWNNGGQDRGNPALEIDPGLGTWNDLHRAIAQIQAKGVKMVLFGKFPFADITTDWYKNELYRYQCADPYGVPYQSVGDSYLTPTQLAGINNRRFAVMDYLSPGYREIAAREFQKILDLGAVGWLFDQVDSHGPAMYNFAAGHGYEPPGYLGAGDIPLAQRLHAASERLNPDFLFSGEAVKDSLRPYYGCSYFRITSESTAVDRYIDPRAPMMVAVTGFDDREMLNLVLLDRYLISYEPYNFKGRLADFPLTLAYGKKIDALRRRYRAWLWDADFRDTMGAAVRANGPVRHSVFVNDAGRRAVVMVNPSPDQAIEARVELPNPGRLVTASPEAPDAQATDGRVEIPARSAAVVMEE